MLVISHADQKPDRQLWRLAPADIAVGVWEQMAAPSVRSAADAAQVDLAECDVCLTNVRSRYFKLEPFDWSGFDGLRVHYEPDAWISYSPATPQLHGKHAAVYHRDRFHLMISTGKKTASCLRRDGVNAVWVPKGYDSTLISDLGSDRSGICTYGAPWPSRQALLARLGDAVTNVSGPYEELNERLNRYAGAVVCNMPGRTPLGKVGRGIRRWWPGFVRTWPAIEPMIKTFEVAGAGCAPIVDHLDELDDLGFVDGETCLTYRTFDEASSIVRQADHDGLREIGAAAAQLARSRHTWHHRATDLMHHVEAMMTSRTQQSWSAAQRGPDWPPDNRTDGSPIVQPDSQ